MAQDHTADTYGKTLGSDRGDADFDPTEILSAFQGLGKQVHMLTGVSGRVGALVMGNARRLERAKLSSLEIDRAALAVKLGVDAPRVRELDVQIGDVSTRLATVESLRTRAAAAMPRVGKNSAVVFGRVVAANGDPVADMRVVAKNADGETVGEDATDAKGRYEIRLVEAAALEDDVAVHVLDGNGRVQHRAETPVPIARGRVAYREISLPMAKADAPAARKKAAKKAPAAKKKRA
jgi:hypothetical protein